MNLVPPGLEPTHTQSLTQQLNTLLSGFQVYYQNVRGLHWNIRGRQFFELHLKFEELYTDTQLKIDQIAERILSLGGRPAHTFSAYLEHNTLQIGSDISGAEAAVHLVVDNLKGLIGVERTALEWAVKAGDDGTADLLTQFLGEQEKTLWMFNAWLG
ncbi:DNA starvation/stationary phase protection protein [bacterium]|nr:DNA starvation/stationary phase protection protein [bacterium]